MSIVFDFASIAAIVNRKPEPAKEPAAFTGVAIGGTSLPFPKPNLPPYTPGADWQGVQFIGTVVSEEGDVSLSWVDYAG